MGGPFLNSIVWQLKFPHSIEEFGTILSIDSRSTSRTGSVKTTAPSMWPRRLQNDLESNCLQLSFLCAFGFQNDHEIDTAQAQLCCQLKLMLMAFSVGDTTRPRVMTASEQYLSDEMLDCRFGFVAD